MELRQYFSVVRKYLWLILLTAFLATGATFYVSTSAPPVYRATTTLEIDLADDPLADPYSISNVRTVENMAEIFSKILISYLSSFYAHINCNSLSHRSYVHISTST